MKKANPQGKGIVPTLQAWEDTRPAHTASKSAQSLLADYCASSLVLAACFDFRPVPGNSYHLYRCAGTWRLSLISPREWGARCPGVHVARCELHSDMTWSLTAAEDLADHPDVLCALQRHLEGFMDAMDTDASVVDTLPFYASDLAFYPRLFASAMARSLRNALWLSGLDGATGKRLLLTAEAPVRLLQIIPAGE